MTYHHQIAFYISSHGYGHAARQQPVVKSLSRYGIKVHMRTAVPRFFFPDAVSHNGHRYDVGMIQPDALTIDVEASLQWYADFMTHQEALIRQEVQYMRDNNIQLILSDMPPIAFEIAERAAMHSMAITHFTWDWVYEHYIEAYPQYRGMIADIKASYLKAPLALRLPFAHPFDMFTTIEDVPLLINTPQRTRQQVRADLHITDSRPMILLSMGGHAWGKTNLSHLATLTDCVFAVSAGAWEQVKQLAHFRKIPSDYPDYHSVLAHADLVVGKAGGSTVAEVIGHRRPFIYTTVPNWREARLLHDALAQYGMARWIEPAAFEQGEWAEALPDMLQREHVWAPIRTDGVQVVTERILSLLL